MKLLVSVSSAEEARAAQVGGADIIDAKDPTSGPLAAVTPRVLGEIRDAVSADRQLTAALGDAEHVASVEILARELVVRGAALVKVGFRGIGDARRLEEIVRGLVRVCAEADQRSGVVAVAYADAPSESLDARDLISIAARAGVRGMLVDTSEKAGPGLLGLWSAATLRSWVEEVHDHGLLAAVAGKLAAEDLEVAHEVGADIAGVRGAACVGGRRGTVSAELVAALSSRVASFRA